MKIPCDGRVENICWRNPVHGLCAPDQNSVRMRRLPREEKATSEVDVDKAPRLCISNDIWILSSDTVTICQLNQLFSNSEAASQREKATSEVDVGRSVDLFPELNSGSCCEDTCFESHSGCSQQFHVYDFILTVGAYSYLRIACADSKMCRRSCSMKIRLVYACLCQIVI